MIIRKISIGPDYKSAMHYIVGQKVIGHEYTIHKIFKNPEGVIIQVKRDGEIVTWKSFNSNVPMIFEYDLDF